ncbi:hypothetical protein A3749_04055, partial [Oleiphilus sp. HI0078]
MLFDISLQTIKQALPSGVLLLACLLFFSLLPSEGLVYPHLINSGHALVFGLATYLLLVFFAQLRPLKELIYLLLFCLSFGLLVELVQPYVGRERSLIDFVYDVFGCLAALLWYLARFRSTSRSRKMMMQGIALFLILASLLYPAYRCYVKLEADRLFPVIANFESFGWAQIVLAKNGSELEVVKAPGDWANESQVGKLRFNKDALYPGMRFAYLHRDWQDYDRLKFEIYSEAPETLNAVLRIHDMKHQNQYHDRFKTRVRIAQGLNQYSIPLD